MRVSGRRSTSGSPRRSGPFRNGTVSKTDSRTPISRPGASARMPAIDSCRNRVRFSSVPPNLPRATARAQQLVEQIAVTVLDVHELKPDVLRQPRGMHELVDQPVELVIGEDAHARGEAPVEHRMRVGCERRRSVCLSGVQSGPSA